MTIGQKIINQQLLFVEEAIHVYLSLNQLETHGKWDIPEWAFDLAEHYRVGEAHIIIQNNGWKAIAKTLLAEVYRSKPEPGLGGKL